MTARMIQNRAKKYLALQAKAAEIEKQMAEIKADLKAEMDELDTDTMKVGNILVRWTQFVTYRFEGKRFKEEQPELYSEYSRPVTQMHFTIR